MKVFIFIATVTGDLFSPNIWERLQARRYLWAYANCSMREDCKLLHERRFTFSLSKKKRKKKKKNIDPEKVFFSTKNYWSFSYFSMKKKNGCILYLLEAPIELSNIISGKNKKNVMSVLLPEFAQCWIQCTSTFIIFVEKLHQLFFLFFLVFTDETWINIWLNIMTMKLMMVVK